MINTYIFDYPSLDFSNLDVEFFCIALKLKTIPIPTSDEMLSLEQFF